MDNVTFQVSVVALPALRITVNRANGGVTLSNDTGAAVNLSGYSITSGFEALSPGSWLSIADNYDNGNPGPNQVDSAHSWSKLTNPSAHTDLSEADLQAGTGASLAAGERSPEQLRRLDPNLDGRLSIPVHLRRDKLRTASSATSAMAAIRSPLGPQRGWQHQRRRLGHLPQQSADELDQLIEGAGVPCRRLER